MASSNVSQVKRLLSTINEGFITTVGGSGVIAGATVIPLNSTNGLSNGTVLVGVVEPGATNQQTFAGTVDTNGSQVTQVVWTRGTNVNHPAGATVVDLVTGTDFNMLSAAMRREHHDDGTHGAITVDSITVAGQSLSSLLPSGIISQFAGATPPQGYLLCQGQAVSRATYSTLYSILGSSYGPGDGQSTFNLPDLRSRVPVGLVGNNDANFNTLGQAGGEVAHALTANENAQHTHGVNDAGHGHIVNDPGHSHDNLAGIHAGGGGVDWTNNGGSQRGTSTVNWSDGTRNGGSLTGISVNNGNANVSIQASGSGAPHNNLQPYVTVNYIIKT